MSGLREIGDGLWVQEGPLRFVGFEAGRIMNVVELSDGGLLLHSPAPLDDPLRAALGALGQVRFVIAPSAIHGHLWMEQYRDAYPGVELHAAPRLAKRRKDLDFASELGDAPDPRWAGDLDHVLFRGSVLLPEAEFLHRASRTLILGDLAMNFGEHSSRSVRAFARLGGMYGRLRSTPMYRAQIRRRAAAAEAMKGMLDWDFDRVIPGHGAIWETGGRDALRREWERYLR